MTDSDYKQPEIISLLILMAIIIGYCTYMTYSGYHQQWSPANGKFIWVDKDGKP